MNVSATDGTDTGISPNDYKTQQFGSASFSTRVENFKLFSVIILSGVLVSLVCRACDEDTELSNHVVVLENQDLVWETVCAE